MNFRQTAAQSAGSAAGITVLKVNDLECVRGERRLFTGLCFELTPHTLLEVRGANGSGKTSLLRTLC